MIWREEKTLLLSLELFSFVSKLKIQKVLTQNFASAFLKLCDATENLQNAKITFLVWRNVHQNVQTTNLKSNKKREKRNGTQQKKKNRFMRQKVRLILLWGLCRFLPAVLYRRAVSFFGLSAFAQSKSVFKVRSHDNQSNADFSSSFSFSKISYVNTREKEAQQISCY